MHALFVYTLLVGCPTVIVLGCMCLVIMIIIIIMRAVQNRIYGLAVPLHCRVCGEVPEYVDHLLSGCTPLVATMYLQRHNRVGKIIHWGIFKCFNFLVSCNYWDHVPAAVVENNDMKVLWDFNLFTDHLVTARHPDIVMIDKIQKRVQNCRCLSAF